MKLKFWLIISIPIVLVGCSRESDVDEAIVNEPAQIEKFEEKPTEEKVIIKGDTIRIEGSITEEQRQAESEKRQARLEAGREIVSREMQNDLANRLLGEDGRYLTDAQWNALLSHYKSRASDDEWRRMEPLFNQEWARRQKEKELQLERQKIAAIQEQTRQQEMLRDEVGRLRSEVEELNRDGYY